MIDNDFKTAKETPRFSYRHHPAHEKSFTILERTREKGYEPIGHYTVLDLQEKEVLSEKKIINLISLLNGQEQILDLSEDVKGSRLYYHEDPGTEKDQTRIVFYRQDGTGISKENALFLIDKEVWGHA